MSGAILDLRGKVTRTSWALPSDLSEEEWHAAGLMLGKVESGVSWWLGDWWSFGEHRYGDRKAIVDAEDWEGPDFSACVHAGSVCREFESGRRRPLLSFNHHREVAALPPAEQDRLLDLAQTEGLSVMKLRAAIRQSAALGRTEMVEFNAKALGKFAVILADPPWRYENPPMGGSNRSIENHYPTMSLDEICALPVAEIAHNDAVLFLWATAPKLAECMEVLDAWGFTQKTILTWAKDCMGTGDWLRGKTEHCLMAVRGRPIIKLENQTTLLLAKRRGNSQKPVEFYDFVEKLCPAPRYAYLFSRYRHNENWDCHGDEAPPAVCAAAP